MKGGGMEWIDRTEDRDRCRALVNAVIPYNAGNFLAS
jgi:hypothetical protein